MKLFSNNLTYTFVISILMLIGQFGIIVHAEEHPFHEHDESCEVFVIAEQSDSVPCIDTISLPVIKNISPEIGFTLPELSTSQSVYHERAPPFLL